MMRVPVNRARTKTLKETLAVAYLCAAFPRKHVSSPCSGAVNSPNEALLVDRPSSFVGNWWVFEDLAVGKIGALNKGFTCLGFLSNPRKLLRKRSANPGGGTLGFRISQTLALT